MVSIMEMKISLKTLAFVFVNLFVVGFELWLAVL